MTFGQKAVPVVNLRAVPLAVPRLRLSSRSPFRTTKTDTPQWARTTNLRFRRPMLYPIELGVHAMLNGIWKTPRDFLPVFQRFEKSQVGLNA